MLTCNSLSFLVDQRLESHPEEEELEIEITDQSKLGDAASWNEIRRHLLSKQNVSSKSPTNNDRIKSHLKKLRLLQSQERNVEHEISELKEHLFNKIKQEGDNVRTSNKTDGLAHDSPSTPPQKISHNLTVHTKLQPETHRNADKQSPNVNVETNVQSLLTANDVHQNVKYRRRMQMLNHLANMKTKSNETKWINWRIENRGKQTIILL